MKPYLIVTLGLSVLLVAVHRGTVPPSGKGASTRGVKTRHVLQRERS